MSDFDGLCDIDFFKNISKTEFKNESEIIIDKIVLKSKFASDMVYKIYQEYIRFGYYY
jgi:hypothetical protein